LTNEALLRYERDVVADSSATNSRPTKMRQGCDEDAAIRIASDDDESAAFSDRERQRQNRTYR